MGCFARCDAMCDILSASVFVFALKDECSEYLESHAEPSAWPCTLLIKLSSSLALVSPSPLCLLLHNVKFSQILVQCLLNVCCINKQWSITWQNGNHRIAMLAKKQLPAVAYVCSNRNVSMVVQHNSNTSVYKNITFNCTVASLSLGTNGTSIAPRLRKR